MKIENQMVVRLSYELYLNGEEGQPEVLFEKAPINHPLVYCQGEGMMLPAFEAAMAGHEAGEKFDFRLTSAEGYGEYDETGVLELDKKLFYNGDGEFDEERVYEGAIVPMNTTDGQIVNARIDSVGEDKVTIDLNHPLAGEDLHFVVEVQDVRPATEDELMAIRNPHKCGGCHGGKCGGEGGCGGEGCGSGDCHCDGGCH